jgi:hypothetical protein
MKIRDVVATNLTIPYPGEVRPAWQPGLVATSHIAVAVGAPLIKFGAPRIGERLGKQNCLLRMEEEFGEAGRFAGPELLCTS